MEKSGFKVLIFSVEPDLGLPVQQKCNEATLYSEIISSRADISTLSGALNKCNPDTRLLVITDPARILPGVEVRAIANYDSNRLVTFGAAPYFHFENERLRYFYWKHYPRTERGCNYLDVTVFLGRAGDVQQLLSNCIRSYPNAEKESLSDILHRYYVDTTLGCFNDEVKIHLDGKQEVIASVRLSAQKQRRGSWLSQFLHGLNEEKLYKQEGKEAALQHPLNIGSAHATRVVTLDRPLPQVPSNSELRLNLKIRLDTLKQLWKITRVNQGHTKVEEIFRFSRNNSKELRSATERIVSRLEQKLPLSFAHYNDGELTFIKDYRAGDHTAKWFGRQQQQYNPLLAERLLAAMQFQKEGYFVGVPCSKDHPDLSALANKIVGGYAFKVPAMSIHHNLAYLPRILHALRGRNLFFFTNEFQDLSFFRDFGLTIRHDQVYTVPFKNSYLEYDRFAEMKFPDDAVVITTCGMLAKILVHPWYQNHERLTVLALGSCMDDHIQKNNSNFELYPKEFPLTRNLHKSRAFLFGYKKRCSECFDY